MKDWKKVKLGSLLTESKIISENPDTNKRLRVRLNMLGVEKRPNTNDKEGATKYYIRKAGQFIYGKQNLHKGAFGIIPEELDGFESSSDIPAFDVDESCYAEWIYYFFKKDNFYSKLEGLAKGVGSKRIQPTQIFELSIYLPSKEEQKLVLEKILRVETKYKNLLNEIENQEKWLLELQQSLLNDAIKGNLTKNWRKLNTEIEPATNLLKRIIEEKETQIKTKKIQRPKESGIIKLGEFNEYIPKQWVLTKLVNLCFVTKLAGFEYSKYFNLQDTGEVPVIRAQNVKPNRIDETNLKYIDLETSKLLHRCALVKPSILMTFIGAGIGDTAVFDKNTRWHLAPNVAKLEPFNEFEVKLNIHYLQYYLMSQIGREQIFKHLKATAQPNISMSTIRDIIVILPPFQEQIEIVSKINEIAVDFNKLFLEIGTRKQNAEQLLQSILNKLLGKENVSIVIEKKDAKNSLQQNRVIKYNINTTLMELIDLLKEHGKLHAEDLWKMSKYFDNKNIGDSIDKFYADLKRKIEIDKSIKEVENEKGYLELV